MRSAKDGALFVRLPERPASELVARGVDSVLQDVLRVIIRVPRPSTRALASAEPAAPAGPVSSEGAIAQLPSEGGAVNDADAILDQSTMAPLLSYL